MKFFTTTCFRQLLLSGILLIFAANTDAFAQSKVSGTIINQRTSSPVVAATVSVKNTGRATITDDAGRFSIEAAQGDVLVIGKRIFA